MGERTRTATCTNATATWNYSAWSDSCIMPKSGGCAEAEAMGYGCGVQLNAQGKEVKKICDGSVCRTKTYNADGSYTSLTCRLTAAGNCEADGGIATYDANGNIISWRRCLPLPDGSGCSDYSSWGATDYTYDANGNQTSKRLCSTVAADGSCSAYSLISIRTYDANGNMTSAGSCSTVAADGSCSVYAGSRTQYTYDANGNKTSERTCKTVAADGSCSAYQSPSKYYTAYDAHGNLVTTQTCSTSCANSYKAYTYDTNGNMTSMRNCAGSAVATDGSCLTYSSSNAHWDYAYDTNGKLVSSISCFTLAGDGSCADNWSSDRYTYDANGNQTSKRYCSSANNKGTCYTYKTDISVYDDNGKLMYSYSCTSSDGSSCAGDYVPSPTIQDLGKE